MLFKLQVVVTHLNGFSSQPAVSQRSPMCTQFFLDKECSMRAGAPWPGLC